VDVYPGGFDDYLHARAKAAADARAAAEEEAPEPIVPRGARAARA
jgi:hypothetical protein